LTEEAATPMHFEHDALCLAKDDGLSTDMSLISVPKVMAKAECTCCDLRRDFGKPINSTQLVEPV
jgi:hypothetical protein